MNVLVTGSRKLVDASYIFRILKEELKAGDVIIHGGAVGVDTVASAFANENNFCAVVVRPVFPDRKPYYLHRNAEMVGMCDRVIAFWDGESRGTKFTVDYAKARKLDVKIFKSVVMVAA